ARTLTSSFNPLTQIMMSARDEAATPTSTLIDEGAKPLASTCTGYLPGGKSVKTYSPSLPVEVSRSTPVTAFLRRTTAFGTAAWCGSSTRPVIVPVKVCAADAEASPNSNNT